MSGYKRVNYYELCRLCTSSQPKDKIHIFRDEGRKLQLQQKIQSCFPLLVCEHDYLPKVVCSTCVQALEQCYTFRQNSINSETMLSSYFANFRFTDDFKKAGKVYVKDTGQKHDVIINQSNSNSKKVIQVPTTTPQPNINLLSETNQPYFTVELPPNKISDNYQKLPNANAAQNPPKPEFNIQNIHISKPDDIKYIKPPNDLLNLNYQPNTYLKNGYEPKINPNLDATTDFSNIMKSNAIQPIMVVDMEQLIESGLPENDVNKLKEVLMKPPQPPTTPPEFNNKKVKSDTEQQINNNNNNDIIVKESSKSFKCEICDKNFKRREHLYQHAKLHSGVRPFNCIHCPKTFSRKEHLMRHLTSHSGVKDFSCDVCSKKFSRPDNLKKHKKTHQKSGPFVCEICQKSFVIKHYYVVHKLQH